MPSREQRLHEERSFRGISSGTRARLRRAAPKEWRWAHSPALVLSPPAPVPSMGYGLLPVPVVQVLPDNGVGLHRPVGIHLRHVHVIDEIDELLVPWGAVISPSLFF